MCLGQLNDIVLLSQHKSEILSDISILLEKNIQLGVGIQSNFVLYHNSYTEIRMKICKTLPFVLILV